MNKRICARINSCQNMRTHLRTLDYNDTMERVYSSLKNEFCLTTVKAERVNIVETDRQLKTIVLSRISLRSWGEFKSNNKSRTRHKALYTCQIYSHLVHIITYSADFWDFDFSVVTAFPRHLQRWKIQNLSPLVSQCLFPLFQSMLKIS